MNRERDESLTEDQTVARDAVRSLSRPEADLDFRSRLRAEFREGSIRRIRFSRESGARSRGRVVRVWSAVATATVAVAAVFALVYVLDRGGPERVPDWRVLESSGSGTILVDGVSFACGDRESISGKLRAGSRVCSDQGTGLTLLCPGRLAVQLEPSSEITLPGRPHSSPADGPSRCLVDRGVVRFSTGPDFSGTRLSIAAGETRIEVRGTTLAVLSTRARTCVSVLEGEVDVQQPGGATVTVPAGSCRTIELLDGAATTHAVESSEAAAMGTLLVRAGWAFTTP